MRTTLNGGKALLVLFALAGCVQPEAGCVTYGIQRASKPPVPNDALGKWVAVTDTAMTEACR